MKFSRWAGACLVAAMVGVGLAGCGGSDSPVAEATPGPGTGTGGTGTTPANVSFNAKAVIDNAVDGVIVPTYVALNDRAAALLSAVQTLQTTTSEANLDAAQAAWRAARVPWESSEGFLFGPVDALQIDPSIDSWPLNTGDLAQFLASNPNATQAQIESASDDLRGFHAIEYLLFGDGVDDNDKAADELTPAELNYLIALTQAFKARTQLLVDSWRTDFNGAGPYATLVKAPGASNARYASPGAVMEELINGITVIADEVGSAKMSDPLGNSAAGADTSQVESQYSWNSLTDFHNNVQSVLNLYTGKLGFQPSTDNLTASLNGLHAFVAAHDSTLATRVYNEIVDAQRKIALVKGDNDSTTTVISGSARPFREQISTEAGRALINTAIAALGVLKTTLETAVLPLVDKTTFTN